MSTKHTPEPWFVKYVRCGLDPFVAANPYEGHRYFNVSTTIEILSDEDYPTKEADAERIVACVNAMAGIENPQKLRESWEAVKHLELDHAQKYKEQRNALLKAFHILFFADNEIELTFAEMKTLKEAQKISEEIEQNGNNLTNES